MKLRCHYCGRFGAEPCYWIRIDEKGRGSGDACRKCQNGRCKDNEWRAVSAAEYAAFRAKTEATLSRF